MFSSSTFSSVDAIDNESDANSEFLAEMVRLRRSCSVKESVVEEMNPDVVGVAVDWSCADAKRCAYNGGNLPSED